MFRRTTLIDIVSWSIGYTMGDEGSSKSFLISGLTNYVYFYKSVNVEKT